MDPLPLPDATGGPAPARVALVTGFDPFDGGDRNPSALVAQALHGRIGPGVAADGPGHALDMRRVGRNALVSALAQGSCFGLAFSLNNYLRATARPLIKQLAGFWSPVLAGFLTSPAETAVRRMTGMNPTAPPEGSSGMWHDAIPSVVLFAINKAYATSRRLPKFAPGTPAGMATTVVLSVIGTGVAGALGEAAAQKAGGRREQSPLDTRATIERGMARAATLVPMGATNLYAARHLVNKGQLPPNLGLKPRDAFLQGGKLCRRLPQPPVVQPRDGGQRGKAALHAAASPRWAVSVASKVGR